MATLAVWRFDNPTGADETARNLQALDREGTLVLRDAATVSWDRSRKKPRTRQVTGTRTDEVLGPSFWGLLFGMIFFVPLLGAAIGAAGGALEGSLTDVGIDDRFINKVRDQVTPGTSALFVLGPDVLETITAGLAGNHPAGLITTTLSPEQDGALRSVFAEEAAPNP